MQITLSPEDTAKLNAILARKEANMEAADAYQDFLTNFASTLNGEKVEHCRLQRGVSLERAFYLMSMDALGIDLNDKQYARFAESYCSRNIKCLDPADYKANPYYLNIKAGQTKMGGWSLAYGEFEPYQGFIYRDIAADPEDAFHESNFLGFFKETFRYLAVSQNDVVWMSITPHEIETMKEAVSLAKGRVVAFGLGLGYFPYMCSLKDEVREIVIVEKDPIIIKLFSESILPQFSHPEKIKIAQADAFAFASEQMPEGHFDFAFVDLWHNGNDAMPLYRRMKKMEKINPGTTFSYWIEESILCLFRRCLLTVIEEQIEGSTAQEYLKSANQTDEIINRLYFATEKTLIRNYDDLKTLLSDGNLRKLVASL